MNETHLAGKQFQKALAVQELRGAIRYASYRCLTVPELMTRLLEHDDIDTTCVDRLSELDLSDADCRCLSETVCELAARGERAPSKLKAKIDRTILRILRVMPNELSAQFAKRYLGHRLKGRRKWAYSAFRNVPLSAQLANTLASVYRERGDQEALKLIARNAKQVVSIGPEFLLEHLDEEYWRARVIEAALLEDLSAAIQLAEKYPFEFAHAVGRIEDADLLDTLCNLFPAHSTDVAFLSIYAYALGKLGASEQLDALREHVGRTFGQPEPEDGSSQQQYARHKLPD